jgi:hypothetical protein
MPTKGLALAIGFTMMLNACSDPLSPEAASPHLQILSADGVKLITQNVVVPDAMDALFQGRVVNDEQGCIRLDAEDDATVIWPEGFTIESTIEGPVIRDESDHFVGRLGGDFVLGGGEVMTLTDVMGFTDADGAFAGQHCPGRYWIVS